MENYDLRNTPEYGELECFAIEYKKYNNFDDFRKMRVNEIALKYPEIWKLAKQDFDLYKMW